MKRNFEIDGVEDGDGDILPVIDAKPLVVDQIGAAGVFVPADVAKIYQEYLREWRWRMATFRQIEKQQMGRRGRAFSGERLYE